MKTKTIHGVNINLDAITNYDQLQKGFFFSHLPDSDEKEKEAAIELGFIDKDGNTIEPGAEVVEEETGGKKKKKKEGEE